MRPDPPLLSVRDLRVEFAARRGLFSSARGVIRAVDGISFDLPAGKTLGLVGESGCGKTTLTRAILRLTPLTSGRVMFDGRDVSMLRGRELLSFRRDVQVVFQDPFGSLNPRLSIDMIVGEALQVHGLVRGRRERRERVAELLQQVGLNRDDLDRRPGAFSGGQRQRIVIARALALRPRLLICDEPVSALDVSIQSQILNLLADLRETLKLTCLFISHNLAVVRHVSDEIAVMHRGRIVEQSPADQVFSTPQAEYTRALLAAAPRAIRPSLDARGSQPDSLLREPECSTPDAGCQP